MVTSLAVDLDLLHLIATADGSSLPDERMRQVLGRELARFADAMEEHFALEEIVTMSSGDPRRANEHRGLHAALLEVRAAARSEPLDAVRAALGDFLDALGEHERAEDIALVDLVPD